MMPFGPWLPSCTARPCVWLAGASASTWNLCAIFARHAPTDPSGTSVPGPATPTAADASDTPTTLSDVTEPAGSHRSTPSPASLMGPSSRAPTGEAPPSLT